jgi:CRISPR system Cascade subunit CasA
VWANIETAAQLELRAHVDSPVEPEALFPWLSATRTSDPKAGGRPTTLLDAHPLQCYFALPRRIRLEFDGPGRCDLTGQDDEVTVISYRQRNYGVQYSAWQHPLSPHYQQKAELLPVHGQTGGIFWRDWLGLVFERKGAERQPAAAVRHFIERRASMIPEVEFAVRAFGFDMDNMKCKGWVEARLPVLSVHDDVAYARVHRFARAAAEATSLMGSALVMAVKQALFDRLEDAKGDFSDLKEALWLATDQAFYRGLRQQVDAEADAFERATVELRTVLEATVRQIFARRCPMESIDVADYRRHIAASFFLDSVMFGKNKLGRSYFEVLGLPTEKEGKPRKGKSGSAKARTTVTSRK